MAIVRHRRKGAGDTLRPTGKTPRRAAPAKSVHPRERRYPGGKLERRIRRATRGGEDRHTRALELQTAEGMSQRASQRRRTTGAQKRARRRAAYLATLGKEERLAGFKVDRTLPAQFEEVKLEGEVVA